MSAVRRSGKAATKPFRMVWWRDGGIWRLLVLVGVVVAGFARIGGLDFADGCFLDFVGAMRLF